MLVVEAIGARFMGHPSLSTDNGKTTCAPFASELLVSLVTAIIWFPCPRRKGMISTVSRVSPLLLINMATSSEPMAPISPCRASAACIATETLPVDERVAAILAPTRPDFPRPMTKIFPLQSKQIRTASANGSDRTTTSRRERAARSSTMVRAAASIASFSESASMGVL